ncbi:MAG: glutaredoxin 3 [Betaproteobacteria bacterium]|nr:glutaredoxin 3 [Betaproteobacteria bacterium]MDH5221086.1 glutaredoxin 3 [Betaproteobacteria bacterium]MDH5349192.1 glutaredoxin 3 [Betaproteobacteria bacterium]
MARVQIYLTAYCGYCRAALRLLREKGVADADIDMVRVDEEPARRAEMRARSGRHTVPQIWIGERHIGGFDDLSDLEHAGELDELLAIEKT